MKRKPLENIPKPVEQEPPDLPGLEPNTRRFEMGPCMILLSRSSAGWHLSISRRDRYPSWDEIANARYELIPNDVTMALILPPKEEYVAVHDHCFHLWQIEQDGLRPVFDLTGKQIGWEQRQRG